MTVDTCALTVASKAANRLPQALCVGNHVNGAGNIEERSNLIKEAQNSNVCPDTHHHMADLLAADSEC